MTDETREPNEETIAAMGEEPTDRFADTDALLDDLAEAAADELEDIRVANNPDETWRDVTNARRNALQDAFDKMLVASTVEGADQRFFDAHLSALRNQIEDLDGILDDDPDMEDDSEMEEDPEMEPDWEGKCSSCDQSPIVPLTGMCGPCTWGEADTVGGNW